ncbi:Spo0E like sporulation regulatory protein [Bacillus sp. OV322]|uniref:aspartyl-phosphate phosphatase Spo0E family protein n=1 Tax=Bacillus sp. OV322 TaxID=1882764 RepID=UPI0008EFF6D6|nr:aspartyl-phosphate phosphatase Spo0E family protein [Bacillus sp. OV322]SFC01310.1 Spo0E like sporulation regulatory protein [Bacillus sp. OV322]
MEAVDALIEKKRQEMIRIAGVWGFTSQETIKASQELDSLLNMVLLTDKYIKETVNV